MIDYEIVNSFVGKPWIYKENDCWATIKKASLAIFGVEINDIVSLPDDPDDDVTTSIIEEHKEYPCWEQTNKPQGGDVVIMFDRSGDPVHCGLYIEKGNILHCLGSATMKNGKTRYDHISVIKSLYPKFEAYRYVDHDSKRPC